MSPEFGPDFEYIDESASIFTELTVSGLRDFDTIKEKLGVHFTANLPVIRALLVQTEEAFRVQGESPFADLPADFILKNADQIQDIALRYERGAIALFRRYGSQTILFERAWRDFLEPLRDVIEDGDLNAFYHIPDWISPATSETLLSIASLLGSSTGSVFEFLPERLTRTNGTAVIDIVRRYRLGARGIFRAFGNETDGYEARFRVSLEEIQRILREEDCEEEFSKIFRPFHGKSFEAGHDVLMQVVRTARAAAPEILGDLYESSRLVENPELTVYLASVVGRPTGETLIPVMRKTLRDHEDVLREFARLSGRSSRYGFDYIEVLDLDDRKEEFKRLMHRFGDSLWGLVWNFRYRLYEEVARHGEALDYTRNLIGRYSGRFFAYAPDSPNIWPELARSVFPLYGGAAPKLVTDRWLVKKLDTDLRTLRDTCINELHIRNFHRYIRSLDTGLDTSLLFRSLEYLGKCHLSSDPLYLSVSAVSDHNHAFASDELYWSNRRVADHVPLVLGEATTVQELDHLICSVGERRLHSGRGIEVLNIGAHASGGHMALDDLNHGEQALAESGQEKNERWLSILDEDLITKWGRYISDGGLIILSGCRSGRGGADARNLVTTFGRCIPHATITGSRVATTVRGFELDESNHILGMRWGRGARTLTIPARTTIWCDKLVRFKA